VETAETRARLITRLAWAFIAVQFLPWLVLDGDGARGFFEPATLGMGWYIGYLDIVLALAFAIAAVLRLADVAPRARLALPELSVALLLASVVRVVVPLVSGSSGYAEVPGIGAFAGIAIAIWLVVVAFRDRRGT
jgi:hypothetical protein